jgi:CheY-like chemotaxis protein
VWRDLPHRGPIVLVARRSVPCGFDRAAAKDISSFLKTWGISPTLVADGGRALLRVFRTPPDLVIVGGHLPGVPGPVVTEILRRAKLDVRIVRVTSMDEPAGAPEFEADLTIEPGDLPEGLSAALERFSVGRRPQPPITHDSPPEEPAPPPLEAQSSEPEIELEIDVPNRSPAPAPKPAAKPAADGPSDPRLAQAERLARIIVADIVLYNEDRFDRALREGRLAEALKAELSEGRALFHSRIPDDIRTQRDFVAEELDRVSAERLKKGS